MKRWMWALAFLLVFGLSCRARPPRGAVDGAKGTIEAARRGGAEMYAPESLAAAERAYASLEAELAAQAKRNLLTRSYDQAESLASEARLSGEKAQADAERARAQSRAGAASEVARASDAILATEQFLEKARKAGTTRSGWPALLAKLGEAKSLIEEAQRDLDREMYDEARSGARAALQRLSEIREAAGKTAGRPAATGGPAKQSKGTKGR